MAIRGKHRIEKLEAALFAGLTPAGRVCEFLKAAADGNKDLAYRIAAMCPRKTYEMADDAYVRRLEDAKAACMAAAATFDKYAFASWQIEGLKDFLSEKVGGMIASHASELTLDAMREGREHDEATWAKVDEAEEKAQADASAMLARMLDAWLAGLHWRVQAEWAGFDAFCRSQFHLDAWTLLKGFGIPAELTAWIQDILAESPPERQAEGMDKDLADLTGEIETTWRTVFLARQGKNEAASDT